MQPAIRYTDQKNTQIRGYLLILSQLVDVWVQVGRMDRFIYMIFKLGSGPQAFVRHQTLFIRAKEI